MIAPLDVVEIADDAARIASAVASLVKALVTLTGSVKDAHAAIDEAAAQRVDEDVDAIEDAKFPRGG